MACPLCETRRARRHCPALGQQICAVCCGTKRLTQIACPSDCPWLASAREHPAAAVVRQQQRDVAAFVQALRDFNDRQSQLFVLVSTFLQRYQSPELQSLIDDDVAEAMSALASTYETAVRGVIYEHRPASLPAERLVSALKPLIAKAGEGGGTAFERDAAGVLRRIADAVADARTAEPGNRRTFLEFLARVVRRGEAAAEPSADDHAAAPPRLIIP